jgi:hypothetical protein
MQAVANARRNQDGLRGGLPDAIFHLFPAGPQKVLALVQKVSEEALHRFRRILSGL